MDSGPHDINHKSDESREEHVRAGLTRRLKRICEELTPDDFAELVSAMTREQLRGERYSRF